jgi:hypothetical protein
MYGTFYFVRHSVMHILKCIDTNTLCTSLSYVYYAGPNAIVDYCNATLNCTTVSRTEGRYVQSDLVNGLFYHNIHSGIMMNKTLQENTKYNNTVQPIYHNNNS